MLRAHQAQPAVQGPLCSCSSGCFYDSSAYHWTNGLEVDGSEPQSLQCHHQIGRRQYLKKHMGREVSLLSREPIHRISTPPLAPGALCIPSQEDAGIDWRVCGQHCFSCFLGELASAEIPITPTFQPHRGDHREGGPAFLGFSARQEAQLPQPGLHIPARSFSQVHCDPHPYLLNLLLCCSVLCFSFNAPLTHLEGLLRHMLAFFLRPSGRAHRPQPCLKHPHF